MVSLPHLFVLFIQLLISIGTCVITENKILLLLLLLFRLPLLLSVRYCEKVYERSDKNLFWSTKNSGEVLNKLTSGGFRATSLSTYDFSTLYTSCPHNLINENL